MGNLQELFIFLNKDIPPMRNPSLGPVQPKNTKVSKPQGTEAELWANYKTAQRSKKKSDAENAARKRYEATVGQVEESVRPKSNEVPM